MNNAERYASIQFALKQARRKVLEENGLTESELNEMQEKIEGEADEIETVYGILQRIPDKPVQYTAHRIKDGVVIPKKIFKTKWKLIVKE